MNSKLYFPKNKKMFYLTLAEYSGYNQKKINLIRNNVSFWDKWIGRGIFYYDFLEQTFLDLNNKILLAFEQNNENVYNIYNNLEGILVYNNFDNLFYNIILLAKRFNSKIPKVGKKIINKIYNLLSYNLDFINYFVLSDVSDIPNYYINLGFIKTDNEYIKKLLDNYEDDIYFIKLLE
jgi:hypothetical protein